MHWYTIHSCHKCVTWRRLMCCGCRSDVEFSTEDLEEQFSTKNHVYVVVRRVDPLEFANIPRGDRSLPRWPPSCATAYWFTAYRHVISCHIMSHYIVISCYIWPRWVLVLQLPNQAATKCKKMSLICQPCSFLFHSFCSLRFKSSVLQAMQRCKCFWWPEAQKSGAMIRTWVWEAREARKLRGSTERARFAQICTLTHRNCASPDQFSVMGSMIGSDSAAPVSEIMSLHVRCVNSGRGTQAWC